MTTQAYVIKLADEYRAFVCCPNGMFTELRWSWHITGMAEKWLTEHGYTVIDRPTR